MDLKNLWEKIKMDINDKDWEHFERTKNKYISNMITCFISGIFLELAGVVLFSISIPHNITMMNVSYILMIIGGIFSFVAGLRFIQYIVLHTIEKTLFYDYIKVVKHIKQQDEETGEEDRPSNEQLKQEKFIEFNDIKKGFKLAKSLMFICFIIGGIQIFLYLAYPNYTELFMFGIFLIVIAFVAAYDYMVWRPKQLAKLAAEYKVL